MASCLLVTGCGTGNGALSPEQMEYARQLADAQHAADKRNAQNPNYVPRIDFDAITLHAAKNECERGFEELLSADLRLAACGY